MSSIGKPEALADRHGIVIRYRSAIAVPVGAPHDIALRDVRSAEILTVDARYSMGIVPVAQWPLPISSGPGAEASLLCARPDHPKRSGDRVWSCAQGR